MNDRTKQVIDFNASDQQQVAVQPRAELVLTGIDFEDVAVDIIDTDVILSNPETGDRLVLLGLAIYLFDEEEVPLMSFEGKEVAPNLLLSKVGAIDNLTMQEFVAVSSLLADSFKKSEEEKDKDKDKQDEESDEESETSSDVMAAILQAIESMNEAQQAVSPEVDVSSNEGKYDRRAVDEEGDTYQVNNKTASPESPALAAAVSEAPEVPEADILFDMFLLQPNKVESREASDDGEFRQVLGGGGSEESSFNPANDAQFSTEVLNYGTASDDLVIQTDNPAWFDANTMTRVIEMTPTFPAGYKVIEITLDGFPDGFGIENGSKVGDTWIVESPEFDARGSLRLNLIYSVPSDESFTVDFSLTAEFQVGTLNADGIAFEIPSELVLISEDSREFVVREVFSANDLNFINDDGEEVWVLANDPNPNRVFSGSGDDQITGSVGVDFIQGGSGDDVIDGGAGTDTLNGEFGDDRLVHGEGFDTYIGGAGVDTLDYSKVVVPIHANLAEQVDGYANVHVDPDGKSSEVDQVKGVENIAAGSGNDLLTGDREDNHLMGGGGEDQLTGGGGYDILDGGDDFDIADYSDSTAPIAANLALDTDNVIVDESNIDTLVNIEQVIGSEFDDELIGGQDDDNFAAGAGDDRLAGGEGSDTLDGGEGNRDVADFGGTADGVSVNLGGSTDAEGFVIATHGSNADRLINIEDLIGSQHDDRLTGNELDQIIAGGDGNDIIDGAAGADTLDGGLGQDQIAGGAGDDTFIHSDGNDRLDGGSDLDTIDFSLTDNISRVDARLDGTSESLIRVTGGDDLTISNVENIIGTAGDDRIQGDRSDNILDGRDGDDILIGAAGNDTLIGGEGSDSADYSVATLGVNIDLSAGEVTNDGFGGRDSIEGIENLTGGDFDDLLSGDAQDNVLSGGDGDDTLIGRAGNDLLSGGEGRDAASYEFSRAAVSVDLAAGEPTQDGEGGEDTFDSIESVIGSALNDTLHGNEEDNTLSGLAGDDTLDGRAGADTLVGGTGNDLMLAGEGSDSFDGGIGRDVLDYSNFQAARAIQVSLSGSEYVQITVNGADDDQVRNVETIIATSGDDVLMGDSLSNTLRGEDGNDVIGGGAGSDVLSGGAGDDQLRFDDLLADGITLSLATNTASYAIDGSTDTFSGFERYFTTHQNDSILTSDGEDIVDGLGGADHFYSSKGNDQLSGGEGDDIVDYSQQSDIDHVEATLDEGRTISITVVGGDDDQVTTIEGIIGSTGDDLLTGDSRNNQLSGSGGNDFLDGGEGDDSLFGDGGQDLFLGGAGADSYDGGAGTDVIDYSLAQGGVAVDLASNTATNDGFDNQDAIRLVENIIGTSDRDVITGDGRNNVLEGSSGDDVIRGGTGSDTLDGGAGTFDEVHFDDLVNYGVTLDLEAGTAYFSGDVSTDKLIGFELYFATAQDDQIRGSANADTVYGLAGDDLFLASTGDDYLDGGSDSDSLDYSALDAATYVSVTLDGSRTVDVEVGGVGIQRITLIENVTGTDGADRLGGDALSNTLLAGDGDDSVFGGAGSDLLEGGAGFDELRFDELGAVGVTLTLDSAGGTALYAADNSLDTFSGFERYVATQQDDVVNTSDDSDIVFTLAGDDRIVASQGADTLDGGLGSDSLDYSRVLGVSSIRLALDNATPIQVEVDGADNDTISNIENVFGTSGDDTIIGDGQANVFSGLGGADTLAGRAGDDTLAGGQGDDHLTGGEGNDVLEGDQGRDTVSYLDAAGGVNVDLTLGVASSDGFGGADVLSSIENIEGSSHADMLRGNASGNVISADAGDDTVYGGLGSDTLSGGAHVLGDILRFDDLSGAGMDLDLVLSRATFNGDQSVDTFSGFERYLLTDQNDTVQGSAASDNVNTLGGSDLLNASAGNDVLDGGAGSDTLNYAGLSDITGVSVTLNGGTATVVSVSGGDDDTISNIENIVGSTGSDFLGGDEKNNHLEGLAGGDRFIASAGADEILGGEGSDTLDYSSLSSAGSVSVILAGTESTVVSVVGSGNDTISSIENVVGTAGSDTIVGDDEQNLLEGRAGDDRLDGGGGADTLLGGEGSDFITGSAGADVSDGGAGIDTIDFSQLDAGQSIDMTLGGSSDVTVAISGGDVQTVRNMENVIATSNDDRVTGDAQDNSLQALEGNDVLGASGGRDTLDGGAGEDTVDYSGLAGVQRINVTLDGENQTTVQVSGGADDLIVRVENIIGTAGNDTLTGDSLDNTLEGRLGNDNLSGGAGNDTLDGGSGAFVDSVSYIDADSGVTVDLSAGIASEDGFGSVDTLIDIEQLTGSAHADNITSAADSQRIDSAAGDDQITLGLGAISVDGGSGSDTVDYSGLSASNAINVELDGLNTVTLSINGSDDQTLSAVENVIGGQGDDVLTGDNNRNLLDGGIGNDILQGRGSDDTLIGGVGIDRADYSQAGGAVDVDLQTNRAVADGNGGEDILSGIENLSGSNFDDVLKGDANVNTLSGNGGSDRLTGGAGIDVLDGGSGRDSVDYSAATGSVVADLSANAASEDGDGSNDTLLDIEDVVGSAQDDILFGDSGDNALSGGQGNDVLRGRGGLDILTGGDGSHDVADYSEAVSQVVVNLATNSAIQDGDGSFDNLSGIEDVRGSENNDQLIGDIGSNKLEGGAGADTLIGAAGNDTLDGGAGSSDTVDYSAAPDGIVIDLETEMALADGYLASDAVINVENIIATDFDDVIAGDGQANRLDALDGDDAIRATAGTDTVDGGDGSDTLDYSSLGGVTGVAVTLNGASISTVIVGGGNNDRISNIENVVGSVGDDVLGGDVFVNRLEGKDGDDRFTASGSVDELIGGDGSDTVDYSTLASASAVSVSLQGATATTVQVTGNDNDTISEIENVVGTAGGDTLVGDDQSNLLDGRAGNDSLDGGEGTDTLLGGDGTDQITASAGADVNDGGAGVDTIDYSGFASGQSIDVSLDSATDATVVVTGGEDQTIRNIENITATGGDDRVIGDAQQNIIQTLDGDDEIGASGGTDTLDGGAGVDTVDYSVLAGIQRINVALNGENATTVLVSGGASDTIMRVENVIGTAGDDTLTGDSLDNRLQGRAGDDTLVGGAGNDVLDGGDGTSDTVSYMDAGVGVTVNMSTGIAAEDGFGGVDTLVDIEQLRGSEFADNLTAGSSTQRIDADGGDDRVTLELGPITVDGGVGSDTVDYSSLSAVNAISVKLDGLNSVTVTVANSDNQTMTSFENVIGSQGDDVITGDSSINTLDGGLGDDVLQGLGGNDTLIGGLGIDQADYSQAGGAVDVDLVSNRANSDGYGDSDILSGIENLSGSSFDDFLKGDANDNRLYGNAGVDTLTGGAGVDVLDGGTGRDIADYSTVGGSVVVDLSSNAASQDGDGANDVLYRIEDVTGSDQDDILYGDNNDNILSGGVGDDILRGSGGLDTLYGGDGTNDIADYSQAAGQVVVNLTTNTASSDGDGGFDTLSGIESVVGSANNDQLTGDAGSNRLEGGGGTDTLIGAGGNDVIDGGAGLSDTVDYSAALNSVNIDLEAGQASQDGYLARDTVVNVENVIGSDSDDIIAGNAQANRLEGRAGDDAIRATAGTDTVDGGDGSDTLDYSGLTGATDVTVTLNGASAVTVTVGGAEKDSVLNIENLVGSTGDDALGGDLFDNRLEGLEGADRFIASGGSDEMHGGAGSDTLDYSTYSAASSINVSLQGAAISTVTVVGSSDDTISGIENVVGTAGNDTLNGDDQQNTLDGRAGSDTLNGGVGDDVLLGGAGSDLITASDGADINDGGAGVDTIDYSGLAVGQSIDLTLNGSSDALVTVVAGDNQTVRNIENVTASGGDDQITGDSQQNIILALDGDDMLGASGGSDTLDGGAGLDTADYSELTGAQRITVALDGENQTTVQVSGSADDKIVRVENIIGTSGNDSLTGDSQDNMLEGRSGDDTLVGGAGNDSLDGGSGAFVDTVSYLAAAAGVTVDLSAGMTSEDGFGGVDTLTDIEQLIGSDFADDLTVGTTTQSIDSAAGDDTITMGLGAINVEGGDGSDTVDYSVFSAANAIGVQLDGQNAITVSVNGSDDQTLTSIENVTGSQGDDVITGDNSVNILDGGAGDDILQGRSGNDSLIGGVGVDRADYSQASGAVNVDLAMNRADSDGDGSTDTLSGIEDLSGSNFDDVLKGDASDNTLLGNGGADKLIGGAGLDVLDGGSGSDVADYSAVTGSVVVDLAGNSASQDGDGASDTLLRIEDVIGSDQDDSLFGDAGANILTGGQGNDVLRGAGGIDTLAGGDGSSDVADYSQAAGQVVVNLSLNSATNDGDSASDTLSGIENVVGSVNNDQLTGDVGNNMLEGGAGADVLVGGGGNDILDGGAGLSDTVDYSAALNAINVDLAAGQASADGYLASDTVLNVENVVGSAQNDVIAGDAQANLLVGGAGDDQLTGSGGIDTLTGGTGTDTADYSAASSAVTVNLAATVATNDGDGASDILSAIENVTGSDGNDDLTGDFQNNRLDGGAGDDVLRGAAGQDVLVGGTGINTADYSATSSGVDVNLTAGQASMDGNGSVDTLLQIQNVKGSVYDDSLIGDAEDNLLEGGNRDDILEGRAGDDVLDGGAGEDTVDYRQAVSSVVVNLASNTASDDGEGGVDTLNLVENVIGSAGADSITGNGSANVLSGDGGDDLLIGAAGNDTLDGGSGTDTADYSNAVSGVRASLDTGVATNDGDGGNDSLTDIENLTGSASDDVLHGDAGSNVLKGGDGDDTFSGFAGNDAMEGGAGINTVDYADSISAVAVDLTLQSTSDDGYGFVDTLQDIQNVRGSANDDVIAGDAAANELVGQAGDDTLLASAGNDRLDGADGTDTVDYSSLTGVAGVTIALSGPVDSVAIVQNGDNDTLNNIENVTGSIGNDILSGDSQINQLLGGTGDDVIYGGSGSDFLDGGAHTLGDELRFDDLNGVGVELDLVNNTAQFAADGSTDLFTGFESYVLTQQDDTITGSDAADVVSSLGGADEFSASRGTDTLDGGLGSDTVDYSALTGIGAITVTLSGASPTTVQVAGGDEDSIASIENIIATADDDVLTGDAEDNNLQGRGGDDTLDGGDGRDVLSGDAGNDTFIASDGDNTYDGGADNDTVDYSSLSGITSISATLGGSSTTTITVNSGTNDLARNVENIIGTAGNDTLVGDSADNRLEGSDGDDTLEGRGGADTLIGGAGSDTIDYSGFGAGQEISVTLDGATPVAVTVNGDETDTVSEVENVKGSAGDDTLIGDSLGNILDGGNGDDVLTGGIGIDTLIGGDGTDTVDYSIETAANFISVQLNGGNSVIATVDGSDYDTLAAIENVIGTTGDDTILGGGSINVIEGRGGDDFIRGGLSNDTLDGGTGINTISFSDSNSGITTDMSDTIGGFFDITHVSGELDRAANFTNIDGSGGNDVVTGDTADNRLEGFAGQDILDGADGNDTLLGGGGDDEIDGGAGDDQLSGGNGDDVLAGGDGDDSISGNNGEDIINAGKGLDTIDGGADEDLLDYSVHSAADAISVTLSGSTPVTVTVTGSDDDSVVNVEQVRGTDGADTLIGDDNDNRLYGGSGDDILSGGLGTNFVYGDSGADTFLGTAGQNTYYGGADSDTVDYSSSVDVDSVTLTLGGDSQAIAQLTGGATNDFLAEIENVIGTSGTDTVYGDDRDNRVQTLAGDDYLAGRAGVDILDGGAGSDTVNYQYAAAGVVVSLLNNTASDDGDGGTDTFVSIENVNGSVYDDMISGDANANILNGDLGDDIFGITLGADIINGHDGTDTVDFSQQAGITAVSLTLAGSALKTATVSGGNDQQIRNVENIMGSSGDDTLAGDSLVNHLQGLDGDDLLAGGLGDDVLDGGAGSNTVTYDGSVFYIVADMSAAVAGAYDVAVGGSGETDQLISVTNLIGSQGNDVITGDANDNDIQGGLGSDTIKGGDGTDTLYGDGGDDNIDGGAGDDVIFGGAGDYDVFIDSEGADTYDGGSGIYDRVDYLTSPGADSISVDLDGSNVTTVVVNGSGVNDTVVNVEYISGTNGDDSFTGDGFRNDFYGYAGDDAFYGSDGSDWLIGDGGSDTVDYTAFSVAISGTMSDSFSLSKSGIGTDTLSSIETLLTGSGDDAITVATGAVLLQTNGGDDNVDIRAGSISVDTGDDDDLVQINSDGADLVLGAGDDSVTVNLTTIYTFIADGGEGNDDFSIRGGGVVIDGGDQIDEVDYFRADSGLSVVLQDFGDSTATIAGEASDTLRNVENIKGTTLNDSIAGNSGVNELSGSGGDDSIIASDGADVINGGSGSDTVDYSSFAATNFITASLDANTAIPVSVNGRDAQTLSAIENLIGSSGNDTLAGDDLVNRIDGSAGDDRIMGSAGNDVLAGGAGSADILDYSAFTTSLNINFQSGTALDGDGSTDSFTGFEQYILTAQSDTIRGSNLSDNLSGAAGDDYFHASAGADVLDGGLDVDTLDYSTLAISSLSVVLDESNEVTVDIVSGDNDKISGFENIIGSLGGDTITGDGLDNTISGFGGDDELDGGAGDDNINGDAGDDRLIASAGSDILDGGADSDTVDFSALTGFTGVTGVTLDLDGVTPVTATVADGSNVSIANIENITGSIVDDVLSGDDSANEISGGLGDDVLRGEAGDDVLSGDAGDDTLSGEAGDDILSGGAGDDTLSGGTGADTLSGGTGIDGLSGGDGADILIGGADDDTLAGGNDIDLLQGDAGRDALYGDAGADTLEGGADDDTLTGGEGDDILTGGSGNDIVQGDDGDDQLIAGDGADQYEGGTGVDTLDYSTQTSANSVNLMLDGPNAATATVAGDVNDTVRDIENVIGTSGSDTLTGDANANILDGGVGSDVLSGGAGADTLLGGDGNDTLDGGDHDDVLEGAAGADTLIASAGSDTIDGGSGFDKVDFSTLAGLTGMPGVTLALNGATSATAAVSGDIDTIVNVEAITGSSGDDILSGDSSVNIISGGLGDDILSGGAASDVLSGDAGDDRLDGGVGNDIMDGGTGDDWLFASTGVDTIDGGDGNDTLDYSTLGSGTAVSLILNGASQVNVAVTGSGNDIVSDIENVIGTAGADSLTGDAADNALTGGAGNDTLDGRDGVDALDGGDGDDTFLASNGSDDIDGGAGADVVDYSALTGVTGVTIVLNGAGSATAFVAGSSNDTLTNIEDIVGSVGVDLLTGDSAANVLEGSLGNDILKGGAGNDTLDGGAGDDTLTGGDGVDGVSGGAGADLLIAGKGTDTFDGGTDVDTLDYSLHTTASAITVILNGATAATVFTGSDNDLVMNVENIIGTTGADTLTGDAANNALTGGADGDRLTGGAGDDVLAGGTGDDILSGGTGDDTVDGGDGSDLLIGGEGADTFDGGNGVDTLNYSLHSGATSINVTLTDSLSADIIVGGSANDSVSNVENIVGSSGADIIAGDANDNRLAGSVGNDQLTGAAGNDTLEGDTGNDTLDGGEGDDTLTGDSGFDSLAGGAGDDNLDGGEHDDTLSGGAGNDELSGGAGTDTVDYSGSANAITGGFIQGTAGTIEQGAETDTVSTIENFLLTAQNDLLSFDVDALASVTVDADAGSDTIAIDSSAAGSSNLTDASIDGVDLASIFTNVETIDFSKTEVTTGIDTFDIGNSDITSITGGSNVLSISVDQTKIALSDVSILIQGGALSYTETATADTRTFDWDNGVQLILNG